MGNIRIWYSRQIFFNSGLQHYISVSIRFANDENGILQITNVIPKRLMYDFHQQLQCKFQSQQVTMTFAIGSMQSYRAQINIPSLAAPLSKL